MQPAVEGVGSKRRCSRGRGIDGSVEAPAQAGDPLLLDLALDAASLQVADAGHRAAANHAVALARLRDRRSVLPWHDFLPGHQWAA